MILSDCTCHPRGSAAFMPAFTVATLERLNLMVITQVAQLRSCRRLGSRCLNFMVTGRNDLREMHYCAPLLRELEAFACCLSIVNLWRRCENMIKYGGGG